MTVEHAVNPALRDRGEVGGSNRQEVEHVAHRRAMKVAVRSDFAVFEYHRVVDGGGEFALGHRAGIGDCVANGSGNLRCAAQRVGILNLVITVTVAGNDFATDQRGKHVSRAGCLTRMRAQWFVQLLTEHLVGAHQALNRHCGDYIGFVEQVLKVEDSEAQHAEHSIGSVDEVKTLFFAQLDWRNTCLGQ